MGNRDDYIPPVNASLEEAYDATNHRCITHHPESYLHTATSAGRGRHASKE